MGPDSPEMATSEANAHLGPKKLVGGGGLSKQSLEQNTLEINSDMLSAYI